VSLAYDDKFTFDQNIADKATALAAQVRDLEERRARVESGPNHPELKVNDLAAIDAQLTPLRYAAEAASDGMLFWDPAAVSGADPIRQTWIARARERGRLVNPSNYGPSVHDLDQTQPIKVVRGSGAAGAALGSPSMSVR
jgi:hypothetical protein